MRTAVICTGQVRTFEETHKLIAQNILQPVNADLFCYLDATVQETDKINLHWGSHIRHLQVMSPDDRSEFDHLLQLIRRKHHITTAPDWVWPYLARSGSIVEYFQLYKAMQAVMDFETKSQTHYDVIIRIRCDTVLLKPLRPMDKLFGKDLYDNLQSFLLYKPPVQSQSPRPVTWPSVYTVRKNCLWIARRTEALLLSSLVFRYGDAKDPSKSHWWDAESQFETLMDRCGIVYRGHHDELLDSYMRSRSKNQSVIDRSTGKINYHAIPYELVFTLHRVSNYHGFTEE